MPIPIHNQYYFKLFIVRKDFETVHSLFTQLTRHGMVRNFEFIFKVFILIKFFVHEPGPRT